MRCCSDERLRAAQPRHRPVFALPFVWTTDIDSDGQPWVDEESDLDRALNFDPNHPIAASGTYQGSNESHGMTLDELLGPEVEELIRANKSPHIGSRA